MAITATVILKDAEGNTIYTKSSLTISATSVNFVDTNNQPLQIPLAGAHTMDVTVQGGTPVTQQTVAVRLLIQK